MSEVEIEHEQPGDAEAVFGVNARAFETELEAHLVDNLRAEVRPCVSLVARLEGRVVGHVMFTPVAVAGVAAGARYMGLAPVAVLPEHQARGVGSRLIRAGLEACRGLGTQLVFVLGHATYYPRFGFCPVAPEGLHYVDAALDPHFFVLELADGALSGAAGSVEYHPLFAAVETDA